MAISNPLIELALDHIADIQGIQMDPNYLLDDVVLIAYVFDEEELFKKAINQIVHSLHLIIEKRSIGQPLAGNLMGWFSYHFQSQRVNRHPADLRCVYKDATVEIQVRGFGHRHLPSDVYKRLYDRTVKQ
jgi:hypothetical protein